MTTELTQVSTRPELAVERLTHLLPSLRNDQAARFEAEGMIRAMCQPADISWVMARAAALLMPYYEKDTPPAVRQMDAEDWAEALCQYPQWAIQRAVRWWKGEENTKRHRRPLEGDIADRCRFEMQAVRAAEITLRLPPVVEAEAVPAMTNERRRELVGELGLQETDHGKIIGLGVKKMGGA